MILTTFKAGSYSLRDSAGRVVGACDSMPLLFRRPWRRPPSAPRDVTVTIDGPRMQDVIKGYTRLR